MTDKAPEKAEQHPGTGPSRAGFRTFSIVWVGQFASMLGANFTSFALAVHVYQVTDSATALGVILALGLLPASIAAPFAGSLVDRWGSKRTLLISSVGTMLVMLAMAPLLTGDGFAVWQVYVIVIMTSALTSLQIPALGALTPLLVPKRHLGRANGMRMVAIAVSHVLAPVSAGFLLVAVDLIGIVILHIVSFGLAIVTIAVAPVPRVPRDPVADGTRSSLLSEFAVAWRYVAVRRGLLTLLIFLASVNFSAGLLELLINPLVLSFASAKELGTVLSVGGLGMVLAGTAVSVWGGPKRKIRGVLVCAVVLAVAVIAGSVRPNITLIATAAFVFLGALVALATTHQVIWQTKVEPQLLGRVMALITMVGLIPQLFANVLAGVAVDHVFEPLVGRDSVRSPAVAALVGDGPGRGIALCMMLVGVLILASTAIAALSPRLRRIEDELPDVTLETETETETGPGRDAVDVPAGAEPVLDAAHPRNR